MNKYIRIKIAITFACIICSNLPVVAEEVELATEVAVQTGKIIKTPLHRFVSAYGMVEPEPVLGGKPAASSKIAAPMAGLLAHIYCEEGQQVKKDDLLFELDTRSSDALIAKADVAVGFAQKNFARKQQLNATDNVSRKLYDEAEQLLQTARKDLLNAKIQRELLQIKAPLSGTVAAIYFKVGETVSLNSVMADLIDLNRLNIAIRVPSQEVTDIRLKQPVEISGSTQVQAVDVRSIQRGTVSFIGSQVDVLTDTVLIRASFKPDSALRPGQFVSVRILVEERPDRLAVPIASVVNSGGISVISVVTGDSAEQKVIQPGLREGNFIEVAGEGLGEGMTIVTQGAYGLPVQTRIRVEK